MRESNSRAGLPLSATFVKQVNRPGVYGDGRGGYGLTLRVRRMTNGRLSKVWVQRLRINGRATNLGLGSFPVVGLATARERALDNRRKIEQGIDPRIAENPTPTLADALEAVIEGRSASWKNGGRSAEIWRSSVRNHADNLIHRPVDQIDTGDVLRVIGPLWTDRHDTAKKVRQRLSLAFRWAMAAGHRPDDPAGEALVAALPRNGVARRHMAALAAGPGAHRASGHRQLSRLPDHEARHVDAGSDRNPLRRGPRYVLGRDRRRHLDDPRPAHQGRPRVPGAAEPRGARRARRGAPLQRRRSRLAGVPVRTRPPDHSRRPLQAATN